MFTTLKDILRVEAKRRIELYTTGFTKASDFDREKEWYDVKVVF